MNIRAAEFSVVSLICGAFLWLMADVVPAGEAAPVPEGASSGHIRKNQGAGSKSTARNEKKKQASLMAASSLSTNAPTDLAKQRTSKPGEETVDRNKGRPVVRKSTDLDIATKLRDALSRDPATRSWAISVSVVKGVVFLSGTALSEEESARAVELALNISGVRWISNGLKVPPANRYAIRSPNQRTVPGSKSYVRTR